MPDDKDNSYLRTLQGSGRERQGSTARSTGQNFLHGISFGVLGDIGYLNQNNRDRIESYIRDNQRMPTREVLEDITGVQLVGQRGSEFYTAAAQYAEQIVESDPDLQAQIKAQAEKQGKSVEDFFWDESKIHQEGTKEADLFDFYRSMGEAQHDVGTAELARSERDMQTEMAQQRQQLVDEVRQRRQNQLRSGLSSAQVANEEIQMLLMGQQAQQQTAQQHFDQRTQMNQQRQLNPYTAEQQTRQHIQGGQQGAAGMYAAYTGDPIATGKAYGRSTQADRSFLREFLGDDED